MIIIFYMQGKQAFQPHQMRDYISQSFIDQEPQIGEIVPEIGFQQQAGSVENNLGLAITKGKGRPKGQKNNKDKEKKSKNVISQQNHKRGHWSLEENKRYHWFLQIYNKHFICKEMRRLDKIFKTMAVFIGSREAEQCRSHHQKMQKKYHSFASIILYLRRFHYGTEDEANVQQDLINNNIKQEYSLINYRHLQDLQIIKDNSNSPQLQEEAKHGGQNLEPPKQFQLQQNWFDLLGEDYEHRFQIDNFLL